MSGQNTQFYFVLCNKILCSDCIFTNVEEGLEKVDKMKRYCESDEDDKVFGKYSKSQLRYARVNKEILFDRLLKLNDEFEWTKENDDKLIRLDLHIRKLETEMYQKFVQIKQNLDSLIAQGFNIFFKGCDELGNSL